ncbi:beta-CASP ribonuclease aCPSF1, partial [Candidatus Woesearchaeota archaeon]|nr:beta-CASP ribonuclease aCPSF1 [Candidatus Woesearchaeota archaeon]
GKMIRDGLKEINFKEGNKMHAVPVKLDVAKIEISGHADRRELMNFMKRLTPKPRKVMVNHGEQSRCLDLARSIHQQFRIETVVPRNLDAIRVR